MAVGEKRGSRPPDAAAVDDLLAPIGVMTEQAAAGLLAHRGLASLPAPSN